jgi:hypothetical protein
MSISMGNGIERRMWPRFTVGIPIKVEYRGSGENSNKPLRLTTSDVSVGGLSFASAVPLDYLPKNVVVEFVVACDVPPRVKGTAKKRKDSKFSITFEGAQAWLLKTLHVI